MTQTIKILALCFFSCVTISAMGAEKLQSLTNLVNYLKQAEMVTLLNPTNAAKELDWLVGKWECCDRALRIAPLKFWNHEMPTTTGDYPWLKTIEIAPKELRESATNAMVLKIFPQCSFKNRPEHFGAAKSEPIAFEFAGQNLKYRKEPAHLFWLKREKAAQPQWLLLENQENGELLLFQKVAETTATNRAKLNPN